MPLFSRRPEQSSKPASEQEQQDALRAYIKDFRSRVGSSIGLEAEWKSYQAAHADLQNDFGRGLFPQLEAAFVPPAGESKDSAILREREKRVRSLLETLAAIESKLKLESQVLIAAGDKDKRALREQQIDLILNEIGADRRTLEQLLVGLEKQLATTVTSDFISAVNPAIGNLSLADTLYYLDRITVKDPKEGPSLLQSQAESIAHAEQIQDQDSLRKLQEMQDQIALTLNALAEHRINVDPDPFFETIRRFKVLLSYTLPPNASEKVRETHWKSLQPGLQNLEKLLEYYPILREKMTGLNALLEKGQQQVTELRGNVPTERAANSAELKYGHQRIEALTEEEIRNLSPRDMEWIIDIFTDFTSPVNPWAGKNDSERNKWTRNTELIVNKYIGLSETNMNSEENQKKYTPEQAAEFYRQKVRMWTHRFANYEGNNGPESIGANTDLLFEHMASHEVEHADFVVGITEHPKYGETSRLMMRYVIDILSRRREEKDEEGNLTRLADPDYIEGLDYPSVVGNAAGKERLLTHLKSKFLRDEKEYSKNPRNPQDEVLHLRDDRGNGAMILQEDGRYRKVERKIRKLPQQQWDIVWNLIYSFDIPMIGWALRMGEAQTKLHNQSREKDFITGSYAQKLIGHKAGRYAEPTAYGNLLLFYKEYVKGWINSGHNTSLRKQNDLPDVRMDEKMHLLLLNKRAIMPIEFIRQEDRVKPMSDASEYPDLYDFLTMHLGSGVEIKPVGLRSKLEKGFKRAWVGNKAYKQGPTEKIRGEDVPLTAKNDQYLDALGKWRDMQDKAIGDLPENAFKQGGYIFKFISENLGIAKVVKKEIPIFFEGLPENTKIKGDHTDLFVPFLYYAIGRAFTDFKDKKGKRNDKAFQRNKQLHELISQLEAARKQGLKGLGISDLVEQLHPVTAGFSRKPPFIRFPIAAWARAAWTKPLSQVTIPEIARPISARREERRDYLYAHAEHSAGHRVATPNGIFPRRLIPTLAIDPEEAHEIGLMINDPYNHEMEDVFDPTQKSTDTTSGKKG